ncbi:MAG TPA: hypothetical protein VK582_20050 [Pyrinomonadaceae bacterium]|nr:hypothetical protein [Pyrinomonadaceae bacterium]
MALESILKRAKYRRPFLIAIVLFICVLLLVRYFVLPPFSPSVKASMGEISAKLLESLAVSLTITIGIGLFIYWLLPDLDEIAKVSVIDSSDIAKYLERATDETDVWWYMGSTGSYLRSHALRGITAAAKKGGGGCHVIALLLDPSNDGLCGEFARYRNSLKSQKPIAWTTKEIKIEILATILSALTTKERQPQIRVDIGLRQTFSTLRYDVSSKHVIITKEESDAPAIRCDAPGQYYKAYRDEVNFAFNQAREVSPPRGFAVLLDADRVKQLLEESLKIDLSDLDEKDIGEIIERARERRDRHEN